MSLRNTCDAFSPCYNLGKQSSYGSLDDFVDGAARAFEHGAQVREGALGLLDDATFDDLHRFGIERDAAREEDEIAYGNSCACQSATLARIQPDFQGPWE